MPSIFSRIVAREIPAHILREDDAYLAFLDVRPIREGHTLVIPKTEVDDVFDLPEQLLAGLLPFARPVAHAIQRDSRGHSGFIPQTRNGAARQRAAERAQRRLRHIPVQRELR